MTASRPGGSLARETAVMSVGTALSRITGFLRTIVTTAVLGITVTRLGDAYTVANTTPNVVYDLVLGGILSAVFVPVFVEALETRGLRQARHSARVVMTFTVLLLVAVMLAVIAAGSLVIHAYTLGRHGEGIAGLRTLAIFLLAFFMPQIVFYGWGAVATGLLNAHRRFAAPMFAPILNNLVVIATMIVYAVLSSGHRVTPETITTPERLTLAIGTTLGVVAMTVALWPSLRRTGFRWRPSFDLGDWALRRMARLAGWIVVYVLGTQASYLVVTFLALKSQGAIIAYNTVYTFFQLPFAVFVVSIFTALLPSMSSRWTVADVDGYRALLSQGLRGMALVVIPSSLGYVALAGPIMRLVLEHGQVTGTDTHLLAHLLALFATGLVSFSAFQLFLRAFYAMQDTRTPALINLVASALNAGVNVLFFRYLGVEGLALGLTTSYTFATIVAAVVLRRRLGGLDGRRVAASFSRIGVAGAAAAAAAFGTAKVAARILGPTGLGPEVGQVLGGVLVGGLAFVALALALHVEELGMVRRLVTSRVGR